MSDNNPKSRSYRDPLVSLFYLLLRDHIVAGDLEVVLQEFEEDARDDCSINYSSTSVALCAADIAERVRTAINAPYIEKED